MRRFVPAGILATLLLSVAPGQAAAQRGGRGFLFLPPTVTFGLRMGYDRAFAGSDIFDFATENLTLSRGAFSSASWSGEMGFWLGRGAELVFGAGFSGSRRKSEFRDWVDNNNQPIEQVTTFRRMPLTASLKVYPMPRGTTIGRFAWIPSRYAPYVGGGIGIVHYQFRQSGDFIDFTTRRVFADAYNSSGWATALHVLAGVDMAVTSHTALTVDARYTWSRAGLSPDFSGFERIDLSGLAVTAGVSLRL